MINNVLTCDVCQQNFDLDKHFPYVYSNCGHTACHTCIVDSSNSLLEIGMLLKSDQFKCLICSDAPSLNSVIKNQKLVDIISFLENQPKISEKQKNFEISTIGSILQLRKKKVIVLPNNLFDIEIDFQKIKEVLNQDLETGITKLLKYYMSFSEWSKDLRESIDDFDDEIGIDKIRDEVKGLGLEFDTFMELDNDIENGYHMWIETLCEIEKNMIDFLKECRYLFSYLKSKEKIDKLKENGIELIDGEPIPELDVNKQIDLLEAIYRDIFSMNERICGEFDKIGPLLARHDIKEEDVDRITNVANKEFESLLPDFIKKGRNLFLGFMFRIMGCTEIDDDV